MKAPLSVSRIHVYVVDCLKRESPPRATELADWLGVSRMTLMRWFRDELGTTPSAYLREARVRYAQRMLRATSLSTTAVAYRSGFGTRRTFYRAFRNHTTLTPAQFRKK